MFNSQKGKRLLFSQGRRYGPAAEAQAGAGEVLVGKEAAVSHQLARNLSIEALAECL